MLSSINFCEDSGYDYVVTLPPVSTSTNKCLLIKIASDCTKLVTVRGSSLGGRPPQPDFESIDDYVDGHIMWARESALLYCDGIEWKKIAGYSRPMIAVKSLHSSQTFNKLTETTIALDIPMWVDYPDAMMPSGQSKIVIQRMSNYKINYSIMYASNSGGGGEEARIALDGSVFTKSVLGAVANNQTITGSFTVLLTAEEITLLGYYDGTNNLSPSVLGRHAFGDTIYVTYLSVEEIVGW